MAYEVKPLTGSLFLNTEKKEDWHPEYKGSLKISEGKEYWFSGSVKSEGKKDYLLLGVQEKGTKFEKKAEGNKKDSGTLEKNTKKENEKQADHKGKLNVAGKDYWVSGWDNVAQASGKAYIKVVLKSMDEAANGSAGAGEQNWKQPPSNSSTVGWSDIGVPPDFEDN
jgi:hypothetical protein